MENNSIKSVGETCQTFAVVDSKENKKDEKLLSAKLSDVIWSDVNQNLKRGVKRKIEECVGEDRKSSNSEISNHKCSNNYDKDNSNDENDTPRNDNTDIRSSVSSASSESSSCRKVYGLRPRPGHRKIWIEEQVEDPSTILSFPTSSPSQEISGEIESSDFNPEGTFKSTHSSKGRSKNSRSKPLSKYRRITANARERDRMKEINTAFTTLRGVLPTYTHSRINNMTKYSTLQLAVSYIKGLSDLLNGTNSVVNENTKGEPCSGEPTSIRDMNLSVGISEIGCDSVGSDEQKPSDFVMYSKSSNFNFTDEAIQRFDEEFEDLPEMRWALDLMMDQ